MFVACSVVCEQRTKSSLPNALILAGTSIIKPVTKKSQLSFAELAGPGISENSERPSSVRSKAMLFRLSRIGP